MPALVSWLLTGLLAIAKPLAGQVLIALGISVVTYTGVDASLTWLKAQALGALTGGAADLIPLLAYMKVGVSINIIFSATVARLTLNGLTSGALSRWVTR